MSSSEVFKSKALYLPFEVKMKTQDSKTQLKIPKEQKSEQETSEINDETIYKQIPIDDKPTKSRSKKPNNIPATLNLLGLTIILANFTLSNGISCPKSSDIKWMSKNHTLVGCTPCHPCPPSREYSIPCGTEAYIGTVAECIRCPSGKYSDGFNTKPCVACTVCSNRIVKRNCTPFSNSVCGDCLPGYYLENISFACIKCARCCNDGQDKIHPSCSAVGLCKPRPFGCPVLPTTKLVSTTSKGNVSTSSDKHNRTLWPLPSTTSSTAPNVKRDTARSIDPSGTVQSDAGITYSTRQRHITPSTPHAKQSTQNFKFASTNNPWFIAFLVGLFVAAIICVVILTIKICKRKKPNKSTSSMVESAEYELVNLEPNTSQREEKTLEEFINENYDAVDKLSKYLCEKRVGEYDFVRVAKVWKIPSYDIAGIKLKIDAQNGSPVRELLDALLSQRPCTTVKQLADSIKDINSKAYKILKPHFLKSK